MERVPEQLRQSAKRLVAEEFENAAVLSKADLQRVNKVRPRAIRYRSVHELVGSRLHDATAISTFAVRVGLLTPEEVKDIIVSFYTRHPEVTREQEL